MGTTNWSACLSAHPIKSIWTLADVGEQPHQSAKFSFQKRTFGTKPVVVKSFQPQWFQKWSWIHYDEARDIAFCFICVKTVRSKTLKTAKTTNVSFIYRGYYNWKDATSEKGGFFISSLKFSNEN